jgi:radical SAM protein with 4Fe4S-binding SPASM domain
VDYHTAEQLHEFRGVEPRYFQMLLDNIRKFAESKPSQCNLFVNYIVHKKNASGILYAAKLYRELGVENVRFSPMWVPDFHAYHVTIKDEVERQLHEARELCDGTFTVNSTYDLESSTHSLVRGYSHCHFCQVVPVVAADGNVYACHNKAYDPKGLVGSILNRKFSDLWFSQEAGDFFHRLDPSRDCRHQCAADQKNLLIQDILSAHDSFV